MATVLLTQVIMTDIIVLASQGFMGQRMTFNHKGSCCILEYVIIILLSTPAESKQRNGTVRLSNCEPSRSSVTIPFTEL